MNVYVFFFRDDTALRKLLQPSSTHKVIAEEKARLVRSPADLADGGKQAHPAASSAQAPGRTVEGRIVPADALVALLAREGFPPREAHAAAAALAKVFDPKLIRPGANYLVSFDGAGAPTRFEYVPNPVARYQVTPDAEGGWVAHKQEKTLEVRSAQVAGFVESSLYESVLKAGESGALVGLLADLFAWDINFYVDTHPGDHFKVLVEKHYLDGQFYQYGTLLAAEYGGRAGTFRAFHHVATPGAQARYFDEQGQATTKTMLKSPLRYVRVSSRFDRKRFHPILHRTKAHLGIDYAAPVGTPVWASASGRVAEAAMKPGSGNTVVVAHAGGLATRYYHLSRFAKGLRSGQEIKQKEVIGYVGSTGLSTGPHLHFSVTKHGVFIDPSKLEAVRARPVANRSAYLQAIRPRLEALNALPPVIAATNESR